MSCNLKYLNHCYARDKKLSCKDYVTQHFQGWKANRIINVNSNQNNFRNCLKLIHLLTEKIESFELLKLINVTLQNRTDTNNMEFRMWLKKVCSTWLKICSIIETVEHLSRPFSYCSFVMSLFFHKFGIFFYQNQYRFI